MEILPFTSEDHPAVADFWAAIFEELGWKVNPHDGFDDIPAYFHFPEGFLFVAKEKEEIVACGGVKPLDATIAIIKRFYIAPPFRGKGVAPKLLEKLIEGSKERHFSRLVLDVYYTNTRAAGFYEKQGFTKYHQKPVADWEQTTAPDKFFYYQLDIDP